MFRTATVLALVGSASAAAADYSSAEVGCTNAYNVVTCDSLWPEGETACAGNALCQWTESGDDTNCELAAGATTADAWEADTNAADAELAATDTTCGAKAEDDCSGDCAWDPNDNDGSGRCAVTAAKTGTVLGLAEANGGITASFMNDMFDSLTCQVLESTACVTDGCAVVTMTMDGQTESRCLATAAKKVAVIKEKCDTAGATAYTAAAAAATPSGANTAAPAMVVISALVGALAIFA